MPPYKDAISNRANFFIVKDETIPCTPKPLEDGRTKNVVGDVEDKVGGQVLVVLVKEVKEDTCDEFSHQEGNSCYSNV